MEEQCRHAGQREAGDAGAVSTVVREHSGTGQDAELGGREGRAHVGAGEAAGRADRDRSLMARRVIDRCELKMVLRNKPWPMRARAGRDMVVEKEVSERRGTQSSS